ncbi:PREDICTED: uncharacterized protein LOC104759954 [Camelina sativa]|uniref:Uncharacterized protein LOC104759954 n=1 Tax=Camelina sativa TaxID=90675 RepID=A0ABM0X5P3_CAMSA|nr:PREDICTED: uncharacterized protein LOC104759954 [Camelina sativa]
MDAPSAPSSASHGWRGILLGREILRKGLGWTIGDGMDIDVWNNSWLSTSRPLTPIGPPNKDNASLKVKDLLCPSTNEWNVNAIRNHLPQYEDMIRKLITSTHRHRDSLAWLPEKSGVYSTKSGYAKAILSESTSVSPSFNWQSSIWNLQTAPKLKSFLWKVTNNALALGSNLAKRGIGSANLCKRCGILEDELHIFLLCPYAAKVLDLTPGLMKPTDNPLPTSICHLIKTAGLIQNLPPTGIASTPIFPWIFWLLWKARNCLVFEDRVITEKDTSTKAIREARLWYEAQAKDPKPQRTLPPPQNQEPLLSSFSCFVKAAWSPTSCQCGLGWVFKDPLTHISSSFSTSRDFVGSALVAEALAVCSALTMAAGMYGDLNISVFSDSKILMTLINTKDSTTELKRILHVIALLKSSFASISYNFIPRAWDAAADSVAKLALMARNLSSSNGV